MKKILINKRSYLSRPYKVLQHLNGNWTKPASHWMYWMHLSWHFLISSYQTNNWKRSEVRTIKQMKKAKVSPLNSTKDGKILLDEQEYSDQSRIEYICNTCHTGPLVTINDKTGNSDLFCRRCGITYDLEDDTVRHKSRLSVPLETEPAVATTPGQEYLNKSVEIHHEPELKGAFKELRDRGIRITSYRED